MEIRRIKLRKAELLICPVGDIQYQDGAFCELDRLKRYIRWAVEQGGYLLGMGDMIDFLSPGNRQRLLAASLYESAKEAIDNAAFGLASDLYKKALRPSRGHWAGLLEGHHFYVSEGGLTTDQFLCERLKAPFLGNAAHIIFEFPNGTECVVFAHHGAGSSQMLAGVFNRLEKLMRDHDADVVLMGHQHKLAFLRATRLSVVKVDGEDCLKERHVILGATGSYLRGYMQSSEVAGRPGGAYPEKMLLPPVALGSGAIWVRPKRDKELEFKTSDNPLY